MVIYRCRLVPKVSSIPLPYNMSLRFAFTVIR